LGALEALRTTSFSGLILDIGIPSLEGITLLKQIRQQHPHIPVIMITAAGDKESAVQAIGHGAQAFLLKPFDAEELRHIVESWFRTV